MRNKVGHVTLGEMLKISADLLLATRVTEGENGPTEEVVYTLNPPLNNPQDGESKKTTLNNPHESEPISQH